MPTLRKLNVSLFISVALLLCQSLNAQWHYTEFYGFYLEGGFAGRMIHSAPGVKTLNGSCLTVGFSYEYDREWFAVNTGAGFHWQRVSNSLPDYTVSREKMYDSEDEMFTLHYNFNNRMEYITTWRLEIPALVGFKQYKIFGMFGPVAGIEFHEQFSQVANVTTTAEYPFGIVPLTGMDAHGLHLNFRNNADKSSLKIRPYIAFHAELGVNLNRTVRQGYRKASPIQLRFSLYADYGYNFDDLITKNKNLDPYQIDEDYPFDLSRIKAYQYTETNQCSTSWISRFTVGARATMHFSKDAKKTYGHNHKYAHGKTRSVNKRKKPSQYKSSSFQKKKH